MKIDQFSMHGGGVCELHDDGACGFVITANGQEVMSTARHASEEKLGLIGCHFLRHARGAKVLIGGLGMGYTLRGALSVLPRDAQVDVVEAMPGIVAWNSVYFRETAASVTDRRVTVLLRELYFYLNQCTEFGVLYHAILIDTDNTASQVFMPCNKRLYTPAGLALLADLIAPGGMLGIWMAARDEALHGQLADAGFVMYAEVECAGHYIVLVRKPRRPR